MKLRCFIGQLSQSPCCGADCAAIGNSLAAFSPPSNSSSSRTTAIRRTFPPDGAIAGDHQGQWALWSRKTGVPVKVEGMEWAKPRNIEDQRCRRHRGAGLHRSAREALRVFSPLRGSGRACFFPPSPQAASTTCASMRGFTIGPKDAARVPRWLEDRGIETTAVSEFRRRGDGGASQEIPLFAWIPLARILFQAKSATIPPDSPLYVARFHGRYSRGRADLRDFIQRA